LPADIILILALTFVLTLGLDQSQVKTLVYFSLRLKSEQNLTSPIFTQHDAHCDI